MKIHLRPLHDQVVVLFGATSGIGLETSLRMAEKGAKVVIVGRNQEGLEAAVQRVREHGRAYMARHSRGRSNGEIMVADNVLGIEADATNWDQVKAAADQAVSTFGRIDTWVHLAAVAEYALFEDTSPDEFRRIIDVNLVGQAYGAMAALPYMKQQEGGTIIFISSVAGRVPIPYQAAYVASKHGILGMADSLRMELKHDKVPVNVVTILPGSINTPLFNKARTKLGVEPEPLKPVYEPSVVAQAIMYAATHPVREMMVGSSAFTMQTVRRLSYPMSSAYMRRAGFTQQLGDEPKSAQDPDNLYDHISGYNQVTGEINGRSRKFSAYTWFSTHPLARLALFAAFMGGAAFLSYRIVQQRRRRNVMQRISDWFSGRTSTMEIPLLRRRRSLPRRLASDVSDRWQEIRYNLPGAHQPKWWEGLPLIGLLPFLHRESRVERARGQVKEQMEKAAQRLNKTMEKLPSIPDTSPRQVSREIINRVNRAMPERKAEREKETVIETVHARGPGGRKEMIYEKVQEKDRQPSRVREKEIVTEKMG